MQAELSGTRDMDILEKAQQRAMKTVKGLTNLSYMERLRELRLQSLEKKRLGAGFYQLVQIPDGRV